MKMFLLIVITLIFVGCGGSSSDSGDTNNSDTISPTIVSVIPNTDSTDVSIMTNIVITFSEEVNQSTLNTSNVTLKDSDNINIIYTKTYENKILTLIPNSNLVYNTNYILTLKNGIKDSSDNALTQIEYNFTTSPPDTTPPTIVSVVPNNDSTDVSIMSKIVITFSEEVNQSTLNTTNVTLKDSDNINIIYTKTYENKILTLTPTSNFEYSTNYILTLKNGIKDSSDNALTQIEYNFTTSPVPDTTPPTILSVTPINGTVEISKDLTSIFVVFSETMLESSLNNTNITLNDGSSNVTISNFSLNGNTLTLTTALEAGKEYTLNISNVKDVSNNILIGNYTSSFITGVKDINTNLVYGLVPSPYNGKVWLDRNLGASEVCDTTTNARINFANDASYASANKNCFGGMYQWGRLSDGHEIVDFENDSNNTNEVDYSTIYAADNDFITTNGTDTLTVNSANSSNFIKSTTSVSSDWARDVDPTGSIRAAQWKKTDGSFCPAGFRVPTEDELNYHTHDIWEARRDDYESEKSFLKLPFSGFRQFISGSLDDIGDTGYLWSSWIEYQMFSFDNYTNFSEEAHAFAQPVRCIKN